MNLTHLQCQRDTTIKTVSVSFDQEHNRGKGYTYKTRLDLKPGDLCNVNTTRGVIVVQVLKVHAKPQTKPDSGIELKWITCKVDTKAIKAAEAEDKNFSKANPCLDLM